MKSYLSVFPLWIMLLVLVAKNSLPNTGHKDFLLCFLPQLLYFRLYILLHGLFLINFKIFNVYLFLIERERQSVSGGGAERGKHRIQSKLQALSCHHRPWCRAWTHKPQGHDLRRSQTLKWLSHPGAPWIKLNTISHMGEILFWFVFWCGCVTVPLKSPLKCLCAFI